MYSDTELEPYKNANPEAKIILLRGELIRLSATIRTYADAIKFGVASNSQEIELWSNKIIEAVDDLEKLRSIL